MSDFTAPESAAAGRTGRLALRRPRPPRPPRPTKSPRAPRPLPDAVAIRAIPVPGTAPPFDDQAAARPHPPPARPHPPPAPPLPVPLPAALPRQREPGPSATAAPPPAPPAPPGGTWPAKFAQALAETLAGSRPPGQLTPWMTMQTRERISQLGPLLATGQRPQVRRVIVTAPAGDVLEMTVIVRFGTRTRVLAVRLERAQAAGLRRPPPPTGPRNPAGEPVSWRCTAIDAA